MNNMGITTGHDEVIARLQEFRVEFGPEMVTQLTAAFISDSRLRLERLSAKLLAGDAAGLVYEAHGLKGSCHNMGARHLGELCALLEEYGRSGALARARIPASELAQGLIRVTKYLETELERELQVK